MTHGMRDLVEPFHAVSGLGCGLRPSIVQEHHVRMGQCRWSKGTALSFKEFEIPVVQNEQPIPKAKLLSLCRRFRVPGGRKPHFRSLFQHHEQFFGSNLSRASLNLESFFTILMCMIYLSALKFCVAVCTHNGRFFTLKTSQPQGFVA